MLDKQMPPWRHAKPYTRRGLIKDEMVLKEFEKMSSESMSASSVLRLVYIYLLHNLWELGEERLLPVVVEDLLERDVLERD